MLAFKLAPLVLATDGSVARFRGWARGTTEIYGVGATAVCLDNPSHRPPERPCKCGFNAVASRDAAYALAQPGPEHFSDALLRVELSGQVDQWRDKQLSADVYQGERQRVVSVTVGHCFCGSAGVALGVRGMRRGWLDLAPCCQSHLGLLKTTRALSFEEFAQLSGEPVEVVGLNGPGLSATELSKAIKSARAGAAGETFESVALRPHALVAAETRSFLESKAKSLSLHQHRIALVVEVLLIAGLIGSRLYELVHGALELPVSPGLTWSATGFVDMKLGDIELLRQIAAVVAVVIGLPFMVLTVRHAKKLRGRGVAARIKFLRRVGFGLAAIGLCVAAASTTPAINVVALATAYPETAHLTDYSTKYSSVSWELDPTLQKASRSCTGSVRLNVLTNTASITKAHCHYDGRAPELVDSTGIPRF